MIMDASLLPLVEKAENGELRAIFDLCHKYIDGEGVPKDFLVARKYLQVLLEDLEIDLLEFEYGCLYQLLGSLFLFESNLKAANENFKKAREFILDTYDEDYAEELIKNYDLENLIKETSL